MVIPWSMVIAILSNDNTLTMTQGSLCGLRRSPFPSNAVMVVAMDRLIQVTLAPALAGRYRAVAVPFPVSASHLPGRRRRAEVVVDGAT
jgi:hypothetical protein